MMMMNQPIVNDLRCGLCVIPGWLSTEISGVNKQYAVQTDILDLDRNPIVRYSRTNHLRLPISDRQ